MKVAEFLSEYNIGKLISYEIFEKGQAHTNFLLNTSKGKFVLKKYHNRSKGQILCELEILKHFNKFNFPCINPLNNKLNRYFHILNNHYYIIYKFLEGKQINKPTTKQMLIVARTLAKYHNISKAFKPKHYKYKPVISKKECLKSAKESLNNLKDKKLAIERLEFFKDKINSLKFPRTLPKGIVHGDFSQENVLFKGNKITAVLDFDGAGYGFLVLDLASLVYFWAWFKEPKRRLNVRKAGLLIKEYEKIRKLSSLEKHYIYDALMLRTLTYLSWNINEIEYDEEIKTNYYEFFKKIVEQVENVGRDRFESIF